MDRKKLMVYVETIYVSQTLTCCLFQLNHIYLRFIYEKKMEALSENIIDKSK